MGQPELLLYNTLDNTTCQINEGVCVYELKGQRNLALQTIRLYYVTSAETIIK
jgi:hypothetical protein